MNVNETMDINPINYSKEQKFRIISEIMKEMTGDSIGPFLNDTIYYIYGYFVVLRAIGDVITSPDGIIWLNVHGERI